MSQQFIFSMKDLKKVTPDGKEVLKGIWLQFFHGAKIGVIGPNGGGKSTLLKIMAGLDEEIIGETWRDPKATVGYLAQEPELDPTLNVKENVELALKSTKDLLVAYEACSERFAEELTPDEMDALITEQGELGEKIEEVDGWEMERTVEIAMDALRVPPGDAKVDHLSGGERRRVALCRLLLEKPDLLLLDEPTNHLDAETVSWLERTLRDYEGTVIIVTHDRYFLDNVTHWILELESGKGIPFEGNYSSWLDQKQKRLAQSEKQASTRAKSLRQELDWIHMGQKARQAKSKARLKRYEQLLDEASSGDTARKLEIPIPAGPRLGQVVFETKKLQKGYGESLLIEDLSLIVPPAAIVGIVGPNGAGKTTLFKMLCSEESPDKGEIQIGETVKIASVEQMRTDLNDEETVWQCITGGAEVMRVGNRDMNSRAYVAAFGFKGRSQQQVVGTLSGGERNRLQLAKVLQVGGNVILLDEPSNDLDVTTLRALEDSLESFAGTVLVISHDRWFLDRIATHILAFEGDSQVVWFEGNYADYELDRRKRLGADADQPHRIKYKPLRRA